MDLKILIGLVLLVTASIPYLKDLFVKTTQNPLDIALKALQQQPTTVSRDREDDVDIACFAKLKGLINCLDPKKDAAEITYLANKIAPKLVKVRK